MRQKAFGIFVLIIFALTACATGGTNTPLPQTLSIEHPTPGTPKEIADYIGVWEGVWSSESQGYYHENVLSVTIVIEKIESSRVTAIYSWGNWSTYIKEGWVRMNGTVENGKIILRGYATVELDKNENSKTVNAIYRKGNWRGDAVLFKKDPKDLQLMKKPDISHLPEKIRAYNGTWTGYFSNGTPITEDIQVVSEKKLSSPIAGKIIRQGRISNRVHGRKKPNLIETVIFL